MRSRPHVETAVRLALAGFVLLCTIQALHWRILAEPGTPLAWQVEWMARAGNYLGCGPVLFTLYLEFLDFPRELMEPLAWIAAVLWAALVYWLLELVFRVARLWLLIGRAGATDGGPAPRPPAPR